MGLMFKVRCIWSPKVLIFSLSLPSKARGEVNDIAWLPLSLFPSVTSSSSHNIKARGLKFGMHNPHIDGSKVTYQIFDILLRSWEILNLKFYRELCWLIIASKGLAFFLAQKMHFYLIFVYIITFVLRLKG